jgi:8-amino-7-oxononanoate synthase
MDLFDKCGESVGRGDPNRAWALSQFYRTVDPIDGRHAVREGRRLLMLGSNDYLGVTHDPRVKEAAIAAVRAHGSSSCGARINNGTTSLHRRLEERLAAFKGVERVLVFSNGFLAMFGAITTLVGHGDVVFCDQENHASLVDGCRAAGGTVRVFRHRDTTHLDRLLSEYDREVGKLIVVDGVFSQTGRISNLPEVQRLARAFGARVMVDDAHGSGVLGANGRGTAEHFGLSGNIDIVAGTFSKAFGAVGGFVGASAAVVEYFEYACRPHLFTAAPPVAIVASVLAALDIIETEPWRRERMWCNARLLQQGLRDAGFTLLDSSTPITPVVTGDFVDTLKMTARLEQEGIFVNAIIPPAVPRNGSRLRITPTAAHTDDDLRFAIGTMARIGRELGVTHAASAA